MEKGCPIVKIIGTLSKKWTLLILRELQVNSPQRFSIMIKSMDGLSPRTLSKRLKELELERLISKKKFNEIPPRIEYSLTHKGRELIGCFKHIDTWVKRFEGK